VDITRNSGRLSRGGIDAFRMGLSETTGGVDSLLIGVVLGPGRTKSLTPYCSKPSRRQLQAAP
jgi:hypothetical protein